MLSADQRRRWRRYWDRQSRGYDRQMGFFDRVLFADTRQWVCAQARGQVLEVGIGTGLNLEHYRDDVALIGIDLSPAMLTIARQRAEELNTAVELRVGDAEALEFADASFDTVVCTFSLCAIPDDRRAVAEMVRILRPGGALLLADHVAAAHPLVRAGQWIAELVSVPLGGEHFRRRPIELVRAAGLRIEGHDRFAAGIVERISARVPAAQPRDRVRAGTAPPGSAGGVAGRGGDVRRAAGRDPGLPRSGR
ncbi:class I SAM-dependent methyltransferase [Pseudonocardia nigra]|uniref:class I SAM-dependent methyltransferase n=1 Tax=Pseudonocardia nigra TaxID=1921578 RepID=UPI001C5D4FD6|nr:class I SAM-dependent methyltransferase [Pseudonocardia nigra]